MQCRRGMRSVGRKGTVRRKRSGIHTAGYGGQPTRWPVLSHSFKTQLEQRQRKGADVEQMLQKDRTHKAWQGSEPVCTSAGSNRQPSWAKQLGGAAQHSSGPWIRTRLSSTCQTRHAGWTAAVHLKQCRLHRRRAYLGRSRLPRCCRRQRHWCLWMRSTAVQSCRRPLLPAAAAARWYPSNGT